MLGDHPHGRQQTIKTLYFKPLQNIYLNFNTASPATSQRWYFMCLQNIMCSMPPILLYILVQQAQQIRAESFQQAFRMNCKPLGHPYHNLFNKILLVKLLHQLCKWELCQHGGDNSQSFRNILVSLSDCLNYSQCPASTFSTQFLIHFPKQL